MVLYSVFVTSSGTRTSAEVKYNGNGGSHYVYVCVHMFEIGGKMLNYSSPKVWLYSFSADRQTPWLSYTFKCWNSFTQTFAKHRGVKCLSSMSETVLIKIYKNKNKLKRRNKKSKSSRKTFFQDEKKSQTGKWKQNAQVIYWNSFWYLYFKSKLSSFMCLCFPFLLFLCLL